MALQLVQGELSLRRKLIVAYSAWGRGDIDTMLAMIADDCEFTILGNAALNPHSGVRHGTAGLRKAVSEFQQEFTMRDLVIEKIITDGEIGIVNWHATLAIHATGRIYECERLDVLEFQDGLAKRIRCFFDSATMALMTGRAQVVGSAPGFATSGPTPDPKRPKAGKRR